MGDVTALNMRLLALCVYYEMYCTWAVRVVWYVVVLWSMLLQAESLHVCSGDMYKVGMDRGRYYSVKLPLKDGIDDLSECERARVVWRGVGRCSVVV